MNSSNLLRANARQTLVRYRALLVALVLGMALLVASAAVAGGSISDGAYELDTDSGLSTLELLSISPSGMPKQLTPDAITHIKTLVGVQDAIGGGGVGTSLEYVGNGGPGAATAAEQGFAGAFWAMPRFAWSQPQTISPESTARLQKGEVLLPDTYLGTSLKDLVGADILMNYTVGTSANTGTGATMQMRVVGVYDNTSPKRDGESAMYLSEDDFNFLLSALYGIPGSKLPNDVVYQSCLIKATNVEQANRLAQELTNDGYFVNRGGGEIALPRALSLLQQVNTVLAVLLTLFGVGIGVTISGTWSNLRRWDVGVLASLGWSPWRVLRVYAAELAGIGLLVGFGAAIAGTVISVMASLSLQGSNLLGVEIHQGVAWPPILWLLGILVGAPLALALGAAPRILTLARMEPDDALRRCD